ncbi:MAG: hypothetical protein IH995_05445 [Proteobacteria bacterium]|nr:hypothetical protein [Pseudomonadota bacterium]
MKGYFQSLFFNFLFLALFGGLAALAFPRAGFSQDLSVPDDFEITLTSAPNLLANPLEKQSIVIKADGTAWFSPRIGDDGQLPGTETELSAEAIEAIYKVVDERNFFELESFYSDPDILDGDYAEITVTADGVSHQVRTVNVRLFDFDLIAMTINARVPKDRTVIYNALIAGHYREIER